MSSFDITLTDGALHQLVTRLTVEPDRVVRCAPGLSRLPDRVEWLVHDVGRTVAHTADASPQLLVFAVETGSQLPNRIGAVLREHLTETPLAVLGMGIGGAAGSLAGVASTAHGVQPLESVGIIGAGLPRVVLNRVTADYITAVYSDEAAMNGRAPGMPRQSPSDEVIWSRTIGAVGAPAWRRLRSLHVAVVGCGRSGSLAATSLHRLGVARLTLIDPDRLEAHNLGEMEGVTRAELGRAKVQVVADALAGRDTGSPFSSVTIPHSILSLGALVAAKQTDVLCCCVDNPAARLATAFLAALYLKPLLDVGTGIFHQGRDRRLGADIRLVLPDRCLHCQGGVADRERGWAALLAEPQDPEPGDASRRDWRHQRTGSLHSLNAVAVHLGLRLLEDLVSGCIHESTWLRLETSTAGIPTLEHRQPALEPACSLCALRGHGDSGLSQLRRVMSPE